MISLSQLFLLAIETSIHVLRFLFDFQEGIFIRVTLLGLPIWILEYELPWNIKVLGCWHHLTLQNNLVDVTTREYDLSSLCIGILFTSHVPLPVLLEYKLLHLTSCFHHELIPECDFNHRGGIGINIESLIGFQVSNKVRHFYRPYDFMLELPDIRIGEYNVTLMSVHREREEAYRQWYSVVLLDADLLETTKE